MQSTTRSAGELEALAPPRAGCCRWPGGRRRGRCRRGSISAAVHGLTRDLHEPRDGHAEGLVALHVHETGARGARESGRRAEPSAPSITGPMRPAPSVGPTTTAPAPSPNRAAVRRSSGSTKRGHQIGADHEHVVAPCRPRPAPRRARARRGSRCTRRRRRARPAPDGAEGARPRAERRSAAGRPGSSSPRPRGRGRRGRASARRGASRPAAEARSAKRSPGAATRRSRMPVRLKIQSSVTPRRSAIGPLATTVSGRLAPTEAMPAASGA